MNSTLIKDTTTDQRLKYIENMFHCHNGDCDNCGICMIFKGKEPIDVYSSYIEGEKEFEEITASLRKLR